MLDSTIQSLVWEWIFLVLLIAPDRIVLMILQPVRHNASQCSFILSRCGWCWIKTTSNLGFQGVAFYGLRPWRWLGWITVHCTGCRRSLSPDRPRTIGSVSMLVGSKSCISSVLLPSFPPHLHVAFPPQLASQMGQLSPVRADVLHPDYAAVLPLHSIGWFLLATINEQESTTTHLKLCPRFVQEALRNRISLFLEHQAFFNEISDVMITWLHILPDWVGCSKLRTFRPSNLI